MVVRSYGKSFKMLFCTHDYVKRKKIGFVSKKINDNTETYVRYQCGTCGLVFDILLDEEEKRIWWRDLIREHGFESKDGRPPLI